MKAVWIILFLMLSLPSFGQEPKGKLALGLYSGTQAGWWVFDAGSDDPAIRNNQGWDRTHLAIIWNSGISVRYRIGKMKVGLGAGLVDLRDRIMIQSADQTWDRERYLIADVSLKGKFFHFIAEYDLIQRSRFSLSPELKLGTFRLEHYSPEKPFMTGNFHWEIGINSEFRFGRLGLLFRPVYTSAMTFHNKPGFFRQRSTLVGLGVQTGLRFWFI